MHHSQQEWIRRFTELGAYWHHDGTPTRPHALLTSGMHSDGFFNWSIIAQYPRLHQEVASELAKMVKEELGSIKADVSRVVGPGSGAITLAHCIAASGINRDCNSGYTEKQDDGSMSIGRFNVSGQLVLACEDTITSGGSVNKSIAAIQKAGGKVLPVIASVCNRSPLQEIDGRQIVALITVPMHTWEPSECPLCAQGSNALRPKHGNNWELLQASY